MLDYLPAIKLTDPMDISGRINQAAGISKMGPFGEKKRFLKPVLCMNAASGLHKGQLIVSPQLTKGSECFEISRVTTGLL